MKRKILLPILMGTTVFTAILPGALASNGPKLTIVNKIAIPDTDKTNLKLFLNYNISYKNNQQQANLPLSTTTSVVDWSKYSNFSINAASFSGYVMDNDYNVISISSDSSCQLAKNLPAGAATVTLKAARIDAADYLALCTYQ